LSFQFTPYVIPLIISGVVLGFLAIYGWRNRIDPGAPAFTGAMISAMGWSLFYALEIAGVGLETKIFWADVQYAFIGPLPLFWLAASLRLTGHKPLQRLIALGLAAVPVVTNVLLWTNNLHHLARVKPSVDVSFAPLTLLHADYGYWIKLAWFPFMLFIFGWCVRLYVEAVVVSRATYRTQYILLLVATLLPLTAGQAYILAVPPINNINFTPMMFSISALIFLAAIYRRSFRFIMPLARESLIENMSDGMLVFDLHNRLLDFNPAVVGILDKPLARQLGNPASEAFKEHTGLLQYIEKGEQELVEFPISKGSVLSTYQARRSEVIDRQGNHVGKTLLLHDVTLQVAMVEQLKAQSRLDELTWVFNHRTFIEEARQEIVRARRSPPHPLTLALVDTDKLGKINESYGYSSGERVLQMLTALCSDILRTEDIIGRLSSNTFAILFPETTTEEACIALERLRQNLAASPLRFGEDEVYITASYGVTGLIQAEVETIEGMIRVAEKALVSAKAAGGNCIISI